MTWKELCVKCPIITHSEALYASQEEAMVAQAEFFKNHRFIFKTLTNNEAEVLRLRYGIDDDQFLTYAQISEHINLTRARIYQVEKKAIEKLRKMGRISLMIKYTDETFDESVLHDQVRNYTSLIRHDILRTASQDALEVVEDVDIANLNIKLGKNPRILKRFMDKLSQNNIQTCGDFINKLKNYESIHQFYLDTGINYDEYNAFVSVLCDLITQGKVKITSQELRDVYFSHVELKDKRQIDIDLKKYRKQQEYKLEKKLIESKRKDRLRDAKLCPEFLLIEDLRLSTRSYNALKAVGVNTLADLIAKKGQLHNIKNLGSGSIGEILRKTRAIGFELNPHFQGKLYYYNIKGL